MTKLKQVKILFYSVFATVLLGIAISVFLPDTTTSKPSAKNIGFADKLADFDLFISEVHADTIPTDTSGIVIYLQTTPEVITEVNFDSLQFNVTAFDTIPQKTNQLYINNVAAIALYIDNYPEAYDSCKNCSVYIKEMSDFGALGGGAHAFEFRVRDYDGNVKKYPAGEALEIINRYYALDKG